MGYFIILIQNSVFGSILLKIRATCYFLRFPEYLVGSQFNMFDLFVLLLHTCQSQLCL